MPFNASQKSPFVTDNMSRFDYNDNRPAHDDKVATWRWLHQTWPFFSRRRPGEFSPRFCFIIPSYTCCSPMLDFQIWYHKMMQVAPSDLARELSNRPSVLLASAEFLASTEVPLRHLHRAHSIVCWAQKHWVTRPKNFIETDTETFFRDPNFRDRDFFLRPNIFETDTETFFQDQMFSRLIPRLFFETKCFRDRYRDFFETKFFWDWYRDFCKS